MKTDIPHEILHYKFAYSEILLITRNNVTYCTVYNIYMPSNKITLYEIHFWNSVTVYTVYICTVKIHGTVGITVTCITGVVLKGQQHKKSCSTEALGWWIRP